MWKRLKESFKTEDTGQYRRVRFAGFKLEYDGMWWHTHTSHAASKVRRQYDEWPMPS